MYADENRPFCCHEGGWKLGTAYSEKGVELSRRDLFVPEGTDTGNGDIVKAGFPPG